jgi:hypothetical protein
MLRAPENEVNSAAVRQVIRGRAAAVVHVILLHPNTRQSAHHLAEVDDALVGGFEGRLDSAAGDLVHCGFQVE